MKALFVVNLVLSVTISSAAVIVNHTIADLIDKERRYVLFNSRRLTEECLPICYESAIPTDSPIATPTSAPKISAPPIEGGSNVPNNSPRPTNPPVESPTDEPTSEPTAGPTEGPTSGPTSGPSSGSTSGPTDVPTVGPTSTPSSRLSDGPTTHPTGIPTSAPTSSPTAGPTSDPTDSPTSRPTDGPTAGPTSGPTSDPTAGPTASPSARLSVGPTTYPTSNPTSKPTSGPTDGPTSGPTDAPTGGPTSGPTSGPTESPTDGPTSSPTLGPTDRPTVTHSEAPTATHSIHPTTTGNPTDVPTVSPTDGPTSGPTDGPTSGPTDGPTASPTDGPTSDPTNGPTTVPTTEPTNSPIDEPTAGPTAGPTSGPTGGPTSVPSTEPTSSPIDEPTAGPTAGPTSGPTGGPTVSPTNSPTDGPTAGPTSGPTISPTNEPTSGPTDSPSEALSSIPTDGPSNVPTVSPTNGPTNTPTAAVTEGCEEKNCEVFLQNLGLGYSEATGPNKLEGCWPKMDTDTTPYRDDSVNLFVGGNAVISEGVEAEGKIVIMGDLRNEKKGWGWVSYVGGGYYVLPNDGEDCLVVGGDISTESTRTWNNEVEVGGSDPQRPKLAGCKLRYKESANGSISKFDMKHGGEKIHEPNMDMAHYDFMTKQWYKKSQYWASLRPTASVTNYNGNFPKFSCTSANEVQVFDFDWKKVTSSTWGYSFEPRCAGKTILVNVKGTGDIKMKAKDIYLGGMGGVYAHTLQEECTMKTSILWNFPEADNVEIGDNGSSEWVGSVLVTGNFVHATSGISGRVIVLGDLEHKADGSEFHAMEFNPPIPLPDPPCDCYVPPPGAISP